LIHEGEVEDLPGRDWMITAANRMLRTEHLVAAVYDALAKAGQSQKRPPAAAGKDTGRGGCCLIESSKHGPQLELLCGWKREVARIWGFPRTSPVSGGAKMG